MKKTIILSFIFCFVSFSNVWAGYFDEFFPVQTSMIYNFDIAESKSFLNVIKDSNLDRIYNELMLCLNKKLSIDLIKDLKEISICFLEVKTNYLFAENLTPFVFINGNFKSKDTWLSIIEDIAGQEGKISTISFNGEEKTVFTAGKVQFIFLNDSILFIGVNGSSELLEKGKIFFRKAPQLLTKVSKMANTYLYFKKDFISRIPIASELFADTKSFDSVAVYIKDNKINFMTYIRDIRLIDEKISILNNSIYNFKKRYTEILEQEKMWLNNAPLSDFIKISKIIYSDALFKKVIDNIKLSTSFNFIIVSLPLENYIKEHVFIFFIDSIVSDLYFKLNDGVFKACSNNIFQILNAVTIYKEKEEENEEEEKVEDDDNDNDRDENENYTSRRLVESVAKSNNNGRFSMIFGLKTLLDNGLLVVEPLKPDPDCEYVFYHDSQFHQLKLVCMKHSFISKFKTVFGGIFRENYNPVGFERNLSKKIIIDSRNCYFYQKEISDSVEKYNKNHDSKMSKLDINTLLESGYLKKSVFNTNKICEYYSEGDLTTDDGCVSCKIHGPESYKIIMEEKIENMRTIRQINFSNVDYEAISEKDIEEIQNCSYNIKMINHEISRYNKAKNTVKITTDFNNSEISDLINKKLTYESNDEYISECKYYIEGDITNNGRVACKKHGYLK